MKPTKYTILYPLQTLPIYLKWRFYSKFVTADRKKSRSQWPRGLRRRSEAARLLRSWVRIPSGEHGCLSVVSVVCCQVEVSGTSWSFVQKGPTLLFCVVVWSRNLANGETMAHWGQGLLYYCHRVSTQLQLTNISCISYIISYNIYIYHMSYHISYISYHFISYIIYFIS